MTTFNIADFCQQVDNKALAAWLAQLSPQFNERLKPDSQRNFPDWLAALDALPRLTDSQVDLKKSAVTTSGDDTFDKQAAKQALLELTPWRKGPFDLHGIYIDTEWRCDWKWQRLAAHIDLQNKTVLDVGCGNGYYSLRMLGAGARQVIGLDTSLLFCTQFQAITRFTNENRATVLPLGVEVLNEAPFKFECIFSMGVLYHRRQPVEHLQLLNDSLHSGGELILETLIVHGHDQRELIPAERYANMRNVWSVPGLPVLMQQLQNAGFSSARCIDISRTTVDEQRPTAWMPYRSLTDALDPTDSRLTIEGYPGPLRAVIIARK
jgi:tRNA (mo5U34)-methyltransferase